MLNIISFKLRLKFLCSRQLFSIKMSSFHKSTNHYKTLGLTPDADPKEIKHKYYQLAHKYHPDKTTGMTEEEISDMQQ